MTQPLREGRDEVRRRRERAGRFLALLFFPLILAGLALWFGSEYQRLGGAEQDAQRAHARQLLLSELFSSMKDAETGQRGFVITGDETFLEPYRAGLRSVEKHFAALERYPTSAAETQRLKRMRQLANLKFAEMDRIRVVRRTQGLSTAAAAVSEGRGKVLMDQIRQEAEQARAAEARALAQTMARQDRRTAVTEGITWAVVGAIALAFLIFGIFFWRAEREREALERVAHEAAARRRAIFDSTLDAIVLVNPSGSIETINPAAADLFGYGEDELVRRDLSLLVDLAPGEGLFLDRIGLRTDGQLEEPFRHNIVARRQDGGAVPVEAALGVMELPDGIHIVAAFRDISEREKAERIKDQFLSTVSHELRTPLTSIIGSLGLLRAGADGTISPAAHRLVVIAENNAVRLVRLVNDLLDMEKFESGEMAFEFAPLDVNDIAARALDTVRGLAGEREVTLALSPAPGPISVRGDEGRLIQVMTNLLGNAVRFTPAGRTVTLQVGRRANHAEVSVIDEGPGIDEELRGRLFNRFAQSIHMPAGTARGTGLGLAISREIVHGHGGSIRYDPAPGGGSNFSFNLPLWNSVTDQLDGDGAQRVLILAPKDDARHVGAALEARAIRADLVNDADQMFAALQRGGYLALLLDCRSFGSDSMLLRRIRGQPEAWALPIIAIATGDSGLQPDLGLLDVVDWIPRPLDIGRLEQALASVTDRAAVKMPLVLHVDDDTDTLEITAGALAGRARMARATDLASARAFMADNTPDVVIVDLALPDGSGEDLIAELAQADQPSMPVIIYSAQEKNGAFSKEVSAVMTKSKRSLSALVETVVDILDRQSSKGGEDER